MAAALTTSELLRSLQLGSEVAESDDELQEHFVTTAAFHEIVNDETDLILGPKGSGKTAIFRIIADGDFDIPTLQDVDVVPAFNTSGDVLFQQFRDDIGTVSEPQLRDVWTAYILTLVGWHLLNKYEGDKFDTLRHAMAAAGLPATMAVTKPKSAWQAMTKILNRFLYPDAVEGKVGLGEGLPNFETRAEYPTAPLSRDPDGRTPSLDVELVVQCITDCLQSLNRRCWVIFDRLDEAFEDDPEFERLALRALMRAHSNLVSYDKRLKTKLFLRSDILDRVTAEKGFVNITHLRSMTISWARPHILDMIVKRLVLSKSALAFLQLKGVDTQAQVIRSMMAPVDEGLRRTKKSDSEPRIVDPLNYLIEKSTDATLAFNPRNIVSMMRSARALELTACAVNNPVLGAHSPPPITQNSLTRAWQDISRKRLHDTLYAEHNSLRPVFELFTNGPQGFDRELLGARLNPIVPVEDHPRVIRELQYCGFMRMTGRNLFRIADLYRPALGLNPHTVRSASQ